MSIPFHGPTGQVVALVLPSRGQCLSGNHFPSFVLLTKVHFASCHFPPLSVLGHSKLFVGVLDVFR